MGNLISKSYKLGFSFYVLCVDLVDLYKFSVRYWIAIQSGQVSLCSVYVLGGTMAKHCQIIYKNRLV